MKEVTIDLHHENNRLKGSIHPNPFEHPISEYKLKELVWKLDREIWAKVEVHEATQSWGREQSSRLIREYFGESDNEINSLQDTINGQRLKLSELSEQLATLKKQVEELAAYIMSNIPGEPSRNESTIECAIRIIKTFKKKLDWISVNDELPKEGMRVIIEGGMGFYQKGIWYTIVDEGNKNPLPVQWAVMYWKYLSSK